MISSFGFTSSLAEDQHSVSLLHDQPALLPQEHLMESAKVILFVFCTISLVFGGCYRYLVQAHLARFQNSHEKVLKVAYQCTNLWVNLLLGLYGIHVYTHLPHLSTLSITERISAYEECATFALLQLGYNAWSIPVGTFLIQESKVMMVHHWSTVCVSSIVAFARNGIRYHAPFFFGVIEISSVPLAIMNFGKENPNIVQQVPSLKTVSRPVFAALFLLTRVILWFPNIWDVLRSSILIAWTCRTGVCQVASVSFTLSAMFLTALQWYWGYLIAQGLVKAICGKSI